MDTPNGEYQYRHTPVMLDEVVSFLNVHEGDVIVDCTLGGGGHAEAILSRGAEVIGIDRDPDAIVHAENRLRRYGGKFKAVSAKFSSIAEVLLDDKSGNIDGILMDLGVSSPMLDNPQRGFAYRENGLLGMSMDGVPGQAKKVVNEMGEDGLARIIKEYGEERNARKIARAIVRKREEMPINTTAELADIVRKAVPVVHEAKSLSRVFQALRIYINDELEELRSGLLGAVAVLKKSGRLVVISYHSLEDRIVKDFIREGANPCICPPGLPICRCGREAYLNVITPKPVMPANYEVERNSRARSARLRACEKIGEIPGNNE